MTKYSFTLSIIILAILAYLVYAASNGSFSAGIVLTILATVLLVATGAAISLATQAQANKKQQADFIANVKENLILSQQQQKLQNAQLQGMLYQLKTNERLPDTTNGNAGSLIIDNDVFADLED